MLPTEVELIVMTILESEEFQKALKKMIQKALDDFTIDASTIDGLEDAVEDIISKGTFEVDTTVTFSS